MALHNTGSVDDIRSSLKCSWDKFTYKGLQQELLLEKKHSNRKSVVKLIDAAITRKWKELTGEELLGNYPVVVAKQNRYVRYPVQIKNTKWVAVDVLKNGYKHLPAPVQYDTEKECAKACTGSNKLFGFTNDQVMFIISESMNNSRYKKN